MLNLSRYALLVALIPGLLAGCSLLPAPKPAAQDKYLLEYSRAESAAETREDAPVMIVTTPRAHGGYDTQRIAYMQQKFGLRYYVKSHWADTPAHMLAPLMTEAMNDTGEFQTLYAAPGLVMARYRLDSELIRMHQDFTRQPSEIHITLRVQLISLDESRVLAAKLFDIREVAESEDAYGGVEAANRATARLLAELTRFCISQIH